MGLDLREASAPVDRSRLRARLGIDARAFVVLFVGYLLETKGIRELLAALRLPGLEDVSAWFVGEGPLKHLVEASPRANLVGAIPNERVRDYLWAADVLALPSYGEGTPTVVVEAGAASLPVVASAVGGTVALLESGRGVLVPPRDVEALAEGLRKVRAEPDSARQRALRLRRFVEQHHDADWNARKLRSTYQDLVWQRAKETTAAGRTELG